MKKILVSLLAFLVLFTQTIAFAVDVEIEDPTPDLQAPVINSIGASGNQVTPQDSVKIIANISDDLSGFNTARITYKKPNNQTVNFTFNLNSTTGLYEATVKASQVDIEGEWKATSIYLQDKKDNSVTLTSSSTQSNGVIIDFSTLHVNVTGVTAPPVPTEPTDKEAPVLKAISVTSKELIPGDKIAVTAEVTDNDSGVSSVRATYKTPKGKTNTIYLSRNSTGQYTGTYTINKFEESGIRTLTNVYVSDKAGNSKTYTNYIDSSNTVRDFSDCSVNVKETTPDFEPPVFTGGQISVRQISSIQAAVTLTIEVEDELSGIANSSMTGIYRKPSGKAWNMNFTKQGNLYTATILIDKYDELGEWVLESLNISDAMGNKATSRKIGVSDFSEFNIFVMGKITITPGTYNNIYYEAPGSLTTGETYQLKPVLRSSNADVENVDITGNSKTIYKTSDSTLLQVSSKGLLTVPKDAGSGYAILEVSYGDIRKQVKIKINEGSVESMMQVTPLSTILFPGKTEQLKVVEIINGVKTDITKAESGITYTSSNPSLVTVTNDGLLQAATGNVQGTAEIKVTYKDYVSTTSVKVSVPVVEKLAVSPPEETLSFTNNKLQLVVKAFMSDGSTKDVTKASTGTIYRTSDEKRATVSEDGIITIPSTSTYGEVTITAINGGVKVTSKIFVDVPYLTELKAEPVAINMNPGQSTDIKVTGIYNQGNPKDLTKGDTGTTYTSSLSSRASVDENGHITIPSGATYGDVIITIKNGTFKTSVLITVSKDMSGEITSISATADKTTLRREEKVQINVKGILGSGEQKDLTNASEGTTYTSSVNSRATVDENGLVTIPSNALYGPVSITVNNGSHKATIELTIEEDPSKVISNLNASIEKTSLYRGETGQITVMGLFANGDEKNLTNGSEGTIYTSSSTSRATVDENGLVTIPTDATYGDVTITISNGTVKSTLTLTVKEDLPTLNVTAEKTTLSRGGSTQLTVKGLYANGKEVDLTSGSEGTTYTSSLSSRATVDENGVVTIPSNATYGDVAITIKNGNAKTTFNLTVERNLEADIASLSVIAEKTALHQGESTQLTVKGITVGGIEKDITLGSEGTTYTSSITSRATVDENGLVTIPSSASYGNVTITVSNGSAKATITLTVEENLPTLNALAEKSSLSRGESTQLTVKGLYANGNEVDLTSRSEGTTYTSSLPSRATVDENGLVTIPSSATYGSVTITIKNGNAKTTFNLTVEKNPEADIAGLSAIAEKTALHQGESTQLTIKGITVGGTEKDITAGSEGTTYTSSSTSRATVDENGLVTIPSNATYGNVTITIINGAAKATVVLSVVEDLPILTVTGEKTNLYRGESTQLTVKGLYTNGDELDLTSGNGTTYTSSLSSRATVDENGVVTIPSGASYGNVIITVKNGNAKTTFTIAVTEDLSKVLTSLNATAEATTLHRGETTQLSVKGIFGSGAEKDVTLGSEGTTYTSSLNSRAKVDENGLVTIPTGASYGNVIITIKNGSLKTTITLKVES